MWFSYTLIALFALSTMAKIAMIGDAREEVTKGEAVVTLIVNSLLTAGIVRYFL